MRLLPLIAVLALSCAGVEALAYWWMHPAPADQHQPVLCYSREHGAKSIEPSPAQSSSSSSSSSSSPIQNPKSKITNHQSISPSSPSPTDNRQPTTDNSPSSPISASQHFSVSASSSFTLLPEIYAKAAPMLRCSSGQVFLVKPNDSLTLHLAFFEWDGTDTGSVLEAFRHMPEACMGSIGMQLVSKEKPILYQVGLDRRAGPLVANGVERQGSETEDRDPLSVVRDPLSVSLNEREAPQQALFTDNRQLTTDNSSTATQSLSFDHTIFRDPGSPQSSSLLAPQVHAFRAVWVSGLDQSDARQGLSGTEFNRLRTIRLHSALTRFRPEHARVIQGTVRGAPNAQAAWQAFEETMLRDLSFAR